MPLYAEKELQPHRSRGINYRLPKNLTNSPVPLPTKAASLQHGRRNFDVDPMFKASVHSLDPLPSGIWLLYTFFPHRDFMEVGPGSDTNC